MYSQANVRAGKVLRPPFRALPSVIVVTEKVMREADGPVGRAALTAHFGWKGDRHEVRLERRSGEPVRSPKIVSGDKRLSRLIYHIHHTCEYKQYCLVEKTAKQCKLGLFQDSDFAGDLEDSKSTSGGTFIVHFRKPYVCSNQLDV